MKHSSKGFFLVGFLLLFLISAGQRSAHVTGRESTRVTGHVTDTDGLPLISVSISSGQNSTLTDSLGYFSIEQGSMGKVGFTARGFLSLSRSVTGGLDSQHLRITLVRDVSTLNEVVVTGTMKEVRRSDSPVPVDIISAKLFRKNPSACFIDAVGMIGGVQPQVNCNVCNTADIRINGMDGPYTLILIDGMPIVSALSTVYGLSGIPVSLIEQIEVVKGPASSLYGSEAMGGIINIITRHPEEAAKMSVDVFGTSWGEINSDVSLRTRIGKATGLWGVNYFKYGNPVDHNQDGFTDLALQDRISVFNKWQFKRKMERQMSVAARYVYEDRWGGQMDWDRQWRGSDSVYGESVYTKRWELIGTYQLPIREKVITQFSLNTHDQDSYYGRIAYQATQRVLFGQVFWDRPVGKDHSLLVGGSYRYTRYDDNTPTTASADGKETIPANTILPGIFVQDEWTINEQHKLLVGYRFDHDRNHGSVHSPRVAYKWSPLKQHTFRASFGTGYRVVNLFTEDHAALTGSRVVEIREELLPERSYNFNLNYVSAVPMTIGMLGFDFSLFYTYFSNKITGDLDTDPNKIIYDNLRGHAISQGISLNMTASFNFPLKLMAGASYMNVYQVGDAVRKRQLYAPEWSGTYNATWVLPGKWTIDLTGRFTGPMRLPVQRNDYRPAYSPWYNVSNLQVTKVFKNRIELYGGVKNLFDYTPRYALMRAFDPFDKQAADPVSNPHGYTFDTEYNYASLQGIRGFFGVRYSIL